MGKYYITLILVFLFFFFFKGKVLYYADPVFFLLHFYPISSLYFYFVNFNKHLSISILQHVILDQGGKKSSATSLLHYVINEKPNVERLAVLLWPYGQLTFITRSWNPYLQIPNYLFHAQ